MLWQELPARTITFSDEIKCWLKAPLWAVLNQSRRQGKSKVWFSNSTDSTAMWTAVQCQTSTMEKPASWRTWSQNCRTLSQQRVMDMGEPLEFITASTPVKPTKSINSPHRFPLDKGNQGVTQSSVFTCHIRQEEEWRPSALCKLQTAERCYEERLLPVT
jgi:hypothetical protein